MDRKWAYTVVLLTPAAAATASIVAAPKLCSRNNARAAAPVKPPFVAPDGATIVAFVSDPDGNLLELISRTN